MAGRVWSFMRSVLVSVSLGLLAGCATVSVVPEAANMETSLTKSQSALRVSSEAFCDLAENEGWAEADRGLAGLAGMLIWGREKTVPTAGAYAASVGADSRAPVLVLARISADSDAARAGLETVTLQARAVLAAEDSEPAGRGDVLAYERALVRAQLAYRNFREAFQIVSERSDMPVGQVQAKIEQFSLAIDEARRLADRLAEESAGSNLAVS